MMNEDIARIRCYYADGSTAETADLGPLGHSVDGKASDVMGVEFIDTFDNVVASIQLDPDGEAIGLVEMEGKAVWTDMNGWTDIAGNPPVTSGKLFSFDIEHDPAAIAGIRAYAAACEADRPGVCASLIAMADAEDARRAAVPEGANPNKRAADATVTGDGTVRPKSFGRLEKEAAARRAARGS